VLGSIQRMDAPTPWSCSSSKIAGSSPLPYF
jgi:hypothetical protein